MRASRGRVLMGWRMGVVGDDRGGLSVVGGDRVQGDPWCGVKGLDVMVSRGRVARRVQ
jgi:hypothetical protein